MIINIKDIKFKFKFREDIDFPATVTFVLGQFEVRGFTIRKSKYPSEEARHAVFPPSKNVGGSKWLHIFYTTDKTEWKKVQELVLNEFYKEQDEHLMNEIGESTNELENIDF